ncbi:hypothetical protein ACIBHX_08730 [Nonomuraea sp. NPDC050536]|uniref:hypothetical protein n=1 Tax=Nonomuraea sp. NPDC050536 TaxID=3364366 RepID=UPI0037C69E62
MADEKDWPGLDPKPDQITYSASKLKNIAIDLARDYDVLTGTKAGSLQDFQLNSYVPKVVMDDEAKAVKAFFDAVAGGNEGFRTIYGKVVDQYRNAIGLLLAGAKDFDSLNQLMGGTSIVEDA